MGRRFVRWSPEELALWLKDGYRLREVLVTDRIPQDAHVVAVRDDPDGAGLLVFLDSSEWEDPKRIPREGWRRLEIEVRWGRPKDPVLALDACGDYFIADDRYENHLAACENCDEFRRCAEGASLGLARSEARERAVEGLCQARILEHREG